VYSHNWGPELRGDVHLLGGPTIRLKERRGGGSTKKKKGASWRKNQNPMAGERKGNERIQEATDALSFEEGG